MRRFTEITVLEAPFLLEFSDENGCTYLFDLSFLKGQLPDFAEVAGRYSDPFVLKRSIFWTHQPADATVSLIKWSDDYCDEPVGAWYLDYEDFFVPELQEQ